MNAGTFESAIHIISSVLRIPAIIILILAVLVVIYQLGSVIVEYFTERRGKKADIPKIIETISGRKQTDMLAILKANPFPRSQIAIFERLLTSSLKTVGEMRLMAGELLMKEESRLERKMSVTDIIARIGPMFGLMATLIPLGPGLIALGQGDTKTLSESLLTAFDATVSGLAAAGVAYIISKVRKRWYQMDLTTLETILDGVIGNAE